MIFLPMSLLYKLLPIKYRNANNGLLQICFWKLFLIPVITHINSEFPYPRRSLNYFNTALVTVPLILRPSLPEDQAGVIHAISPIWMKLCQIEGTTKQL